MKLVFNLEEVAAALGKTENEFLAIQDKLEAAGFPRPVRILDDRWSIMDVINWINADRAKE
jgi:predicted DNA-binding transcriptional regulator AlpA